MTSWERLGYTAILTESISKAAFAPASATYVPVILDGTEPDNDGWFSVGAKSWLSLVGTATAATVDVKVEYRLAGVAAADLIAEVTVATSGVTAIAAPATPQALTGVYEIRVVAKSATGSVTLGGALGR